MWGNGRKALVRQICCTWIRVARFSAEGHSARVRTTATAAALMSRFSISCPLAAAEQTSHMLLHAEGASPKCLQHWHADLNGAQEIVDHPAVVVMSCYSIFCPLAAGEQTSHTMLYAAETSPKSLQMRGKALGLWKSYERPQCHAHIRLASSRQTQRLQPSRV